jgi:hypothetical protein
MRTTVSKRLVIDASVAASAGGETATHPTAKHCRDFLTSVLVISYHVVMTPDITVEWKTHESNFARRWRVAMDARRKIYRVSDVANDALRSKIERTTTRESDREALRKDFHLIEAALVTDKTVISLDEIVKFHFSIQKGGGD